MRVHLDTDFAGDPDDACALAMLLGWPDLEITAVTTVADPAGRRASYVRRLLALAGRGDIAVAAGACASLDGHPMGDIPDHDRYWGPPPLDESPGEGIDSDATTLLIRSIEAGATVAAIGPLTNLARLDGVQPGVLSGIPVVAMGGWFEPAGPGYPQWGPAADWNTQCDPGAAAVVAASADLTLVPLSVTTRVWLRRSQLARLQGSGPIGKLLARQAIAYCEDQGKTRIARAHPELPDDLLNFHHDPLTAAVAAGWQGVTTERLRLVPRYDGSLLTFQPDPDGRPVDVVTAVEADEFDEVWMSAVERTARGARSRPD